MSDPDAKPTATAKPATPAAKSAAAAKPDGDARPAQAASSRRRWLRWVIFGAIIAAIVLFILYARCRGGLGLGGGTSSGSARPAMEAPVIDAGATRCALRLDAGGITVDGAAATQDTAVAACARAGTAEIVVTGDARVGAWDELRGALEAAGVELLVRGVAPAAPL